ncbi:FAD-dependent oxidoreductase [Spirillospora sp. NPDC048824]|uniref:FAD-dependent oxidoreductase n=1 Tax=Spirillospora sp. NPDC048824 TaxID=3364526 RepID=UPI0037182606
MSSERDHDLVVLGAVPPGWPERTGAGLGARALLIADGPIGGDCTFTGCVPSKTLIKHAGRGASFGEVMAAVWDAVRLIAVTDTAEVPRGEGIDVVSGRAVFLHVGERGLRAGPCVIATGARPAVPPVHGLTGLSYLTSDRVRSGRGAAIASRPRGRDDRV